jgi:MATE family multidrug resistance protein
MLSNLGHVMMGVTDNIMVGHLGATSLAAAGLALVIFNVLLLFGIGVSYAITPLVATAHGQGDDQSIIETVRHGLIINLVNALFLAGVVIVGKKILFYIQQPVEVVERAIPFLSIITFSLVPMLFFQSFKQFAEGMSNTRVALIVIVAANILNLLLNYCLIYGHLGFPQLGLEGAAWATFTSRIFMALAIAWYVYSNQAFSRFRKIFNIGRYSRALFRKMLRLGIPSGVQFIFEVAAFDFSLVMIGWIGITQQAAHMIAINLATISYMTTAGLAAAATVRVGYFMGSKDFRNVKLAAYSLLGMAMVFMVFSTIIFLLGRWWLPELYVTDLAVIEVASSLLAVAAFFQLSDGAQVVCASALGGLQDVKIPSLFIFMAYWIIGLPLGYGLAFYFNWGAIGIWTGLLIGLTVTASAMFVRLNLQLRKLTFS